MSKRSEGYLLIDNRGSGGKVEEYGCLTCSHCHQQMIRNPARLRSREWCSKCDDYICDNCALVRKVSGFECQPLNAVMDRIQEQEARKLIGSP